MNRTKVSSDIFIYITGVHFTQNVQTTVRNFMCIHHVSVNDVCYDSSVIVCYAAIPFIVANFVHISMYTLCLRAFIIELTLVHKAAATCYHRGISAATSPTLAQIHKLEGSCENRYYNI